MTTEVRAPRTNWCWWCRRATESSRTVDTERGTATVCDECWDSTSPSVPLDMTRGDDDDD
jgi:hypothetical protein